MFKKFFNTEMNEKEFWKTVGMFKWKYQDDDERILEKAIKYLSTKSDEDINRFEDILSRLLYDLDGVAYAKNIGEGAYVNEETYFSPDLFLYARCAVVANGKNFYYEVLKNPKAMPADVEFEALLYVAGEAFELKNDEEFDYSAKVDYETYSNKKKWNV